MTKCEICGLKYSIGEWPWCPHGGHTFQVDAFEPYFDEHISADGKWISSSHQRRKIMDLKGLDYHKNKFDGMGRSLFFDMGKK